MVTVPTYEPNQVQLRPLTNARQQAANFAAGGDAIAAGVGDVGQGLNVAAKNAADRQDLLQESIARQADAALSDQYRAILRGPGGILTKQGQAAVEGQSDAIGLLDQANQSAIDAIKSPMAKRLLTGVAAARRSSALDDIANHVDVQANVFADQSESARLKAMSQDAIEAPDGGRAAVAVEAVRQQIHQTYARKGLGPEAADIAFHEAQSNILAGRVDALLQDPNDANAAKDRFQRYQAAIEPDKRATLGKTVYEAANRLATVQFSNNVNPSDIASILGTNNGAPVPPGAAAPGPQKLASPVPSVSARIGAAQQFGAPRPASDGLPAHAHSGLDFPAPDGTPVVASAAGKVIRAEPRGAYGLQVYIEHDGHVSTSYSHLSEASVHVGQQVQQGEQIGLVGHSGDARGSHLHYEVINDGVKVDPAKAIGATTATASSTVAPAMQDLTDEQINTVANRKSGGDAFLQAQYAQELRARRSEAEASKDRAEKNAADQAQPFLADQNFTSLSQVPPAVLARQSPEMITTLTRLARANTNAIRAGTNVTTDAHVYGTYQDLARLAASDPKARAAFVAKNVDLDAASLSQDDRTRIKQQQFEAAQGTGMFAVRKEGTPAEAVSRALALMTPPGMKGNDKLAYERAVWDSVDRASKQGPMTEDEVRAMAGRLLAPSGGKTFFGQDIPLYQFNSEPSASAKGGVVLNNIDNVPDADRARIITNWGKLHPGVPIMNSQIISIWRTQRARGR